MEDETAQAIISALESQRNSALNENVRLAAHVASLNKKITELEKKLEIEKESPVS